jgi:calmodulin
MMRDRMTEASPAPAGGQPGRLRRDFDFNDVNRDGRLTLGEFIRFMRTTDVDMTQDECQIAFDEIDTNSDGLIEFAQFLTWWNERVPDDGT